MNKVVESHPDYRTKAMNPHVALAVVIPVFLFSLLALYLVVNGLGWIREHWNLVTASPWFGIVAIMGGILALILFVRLVVHLLTPPAHKIIDVKERHQTVNLATYERQEQIRRENEAHQVSVSLQLKEFELKQHALLTGLMRVPYDANGNAPYLLNHQDYHITTLAPGNSPQKQLAVASNKDKAIEQAATSIAIPERYDMREIWERFTPSGSQIFLSKSAHGNIIVPGNKLLHSISTGPTGGGKTNIVRMQLMQLVYIGCKVTLMDIHYAPIKEDEDGKPIDWRPIINRLAQPPLFTMESIIEWMHWLAVTELQARIDRQRNGQKIGIPIFFTIAELPAVLDEAGDEVAQPLAKILRQGRQYLIFFVGDSQDLLTNTLHMTTGPRECFRTGFYTGGDPVTAKALLDLPNGVKVSEDGLGQNGLVYLKTALHPYTLARVGWASNEALYDLFDTPGSERLSPVRSYHATSEPQTFIRRSETPDGERDEASFSERPDVEIVDAYVPEMEPLHAQEQNVQTFTKPYIVKPVEPTQRTSEERPIKYWLTDDEITQFKAAYNVCFNIDKALRAIGKGSNYREHARSVIKVYGLKEEA